MNVVHKSSFKQLKTSVSHSIGCIPALYNLTIAKLGHISGCVHTSLILESTNIGCDVLASSSCCIVHIM
ncbi:hypothetical protein HanIR_Chr03g0143041 [Helianthus annuus]|nr:hypothetical protein HanIR_Chr03g0143041 [Helianthus annuus]